MKTKFTELKYNLLNAMFVCSVKQCKKKTSAQCSQNSLCENKAHKVYHQQDHLLKQGHWYGLEPLSGEVKVILGFQLILKL